MSKWLICGTRKKGYQELVKNKLDEKMKFEEIFAKDGRPTLIIEGCCPDSADEYAENWAKDKGVKIKHFPSTSGNYLRRNVEMVEELDNKDDEVIAFWDGFSYGTAHTIALATSKRIPVTVIKIQRETKGRK